MTHEQTEAMRAAFKAWNADLKAPGGTHPTFEDIWNAAWQAAALASQTVADRAKQLEAAITDVLVMCSIDRHGRSVLRDALAAAPAADREGK